MADTPLGGRSSGETISRIAEHLNRLLARTVTQSRLIAFRVPPSPGQVEFFRLTFRQAGRASEARLRTRFGPIDLFIGRTYILAEAEGGTPLLKVATYRYTLTRAAESEPMLRWEYVAEPPDPAARWCRHHLQGPLALGLRDRRSPAHEITLNDLHLPTGPVAIEDILRFCIVDLGVRPLSTDWQAELEASSALLTTPASPS